MPRSWTTSVPTLHLALDPHGSRRAALEAALRTAIRERRLTTGTRLPSTRTLAVDLGLARGTVVEAYAQLTAEGYLSTRRGAGTWVADVAVAAPTTSVPAEAAPRPVRFNFNPGLPDLTAFPRAAWTRALRRGLRDAPASSLGYGDPRGRPDLREALAKYLARARGAVADPELVVVCAGFGHGLSLLLRMLHARGVGCVAMEDPCLAWHRRVAKAAGLDVVPIPVDGRGARTDLLDTTRAGAAVLAPAHQFPLGALLHPERRASAVAWARATGGLVIEDDYDAELRYDRPPVGALQALDPQHVAYAGTTSKTLAPGLRLGWLLVPSELVESVVALRATEDVHVPALDQIAFAQLLISGAFERHVRRMRARYRGRRDRLVAMLRARAPRVTPVGISAGLRVLLELPRHGPSGEELADRAAQRSMELFPVGACYHAGRPARDGLVVGYAALPEHAFESGLDALGDLLAVSAAGGRSGCRVAAPASHPDTSPLPPHPTPTRR
jgi:GntR family transcriptional regulator/MocR family aminotransferase